MTDPVSFLEADLEAIATSGPLSVGAEARWVTRGEDMCCFGLPHPRHSLAGHYDSIPKRAAVS